MPDEPKDIVQRLRTHLLSCPPDEPCDLCDLHSEAASEIERLRAEVSKWNRVIAAGCTPSGSEFHDDPERCAAFIKRNSLEGHEAKKDRVRLQREVAALKAELNDTGGDLHEDFAD